MGVCACVCISVYCHAHHTAKQTSPFSLWRAATGRTFSKAIYSPVYRQSGLILNVYKLNFEKKANFILTPFSQSKL